MATLNAEAIFTLGYCAPSDDLDAISIFTLGYCVEDESASSGASRLKRNAPRYILTQSIIDVDDALILRIIRMFLQKK